MIRKTQLEGLTVRIFTIQQENLLEVPTLVGYEVSGESRRHYLARQGDAEIRFPKKSRSVFTDPALAVSKYDHVLNTTLRNLEGAVAESVRLKRAKGVDMWYYNKAGHSQLTTISREGRWLHS